MSEETTITGLDDDDIRVLGNSGPIPTEVLRSYHTTDQEGLKQVFDDIAFEKACWMCSSLARIMPEISIQSLMAALATDPEAFELVQCELLEIRAKLIKIAAN